MVSGGYSFGGKRTGAKTFFEVELKVPFFIDEFMELARFECLHKMFDFIKFHG